MSLTCSLCVAWRALPLSCFIWAFLAMTNLLLANLPTLFLLAIWVGVVYLIKFIASRFWEFK